MQLSEIDDFLSHTNIKELFNDELFLLLRTIAACMNCGIAVGSNSTATPFVFWNAKATELLGRGPTEKPAEDWIDVYDIRNPDTGLPLAPEDIPLNKAMKGLTAMNQTILIHNKTTDRDVCITCNAMPIMRNDKIIGGVVVFQDTTYLQRQVLKLEDINTQMNKMINDPLA